MLNAIRWKKKIDPPKKPKLYREFKTLFIISVTRFRHSVFFLLNKTIVYDVKLQTNKETKKRSSSLHSHVYFVSLQNIRMWKRKTSDLDIVLWIKDGSESNCVRIAMLLLKIWFDWVSFQEQTLF